jgi:hypothetical protein
MNPTALLVLAALCALALASGCGSDSDSGGADTSGTSGADTSGTSGADTSGTSGADTSGTSGADTSGTSGADTSGTSGGSACAVTVPSGTKTQLSYEADIKPLLEAKTCLQMGCHTPFNGFAAGGLDLSILSQGSIPSGDSGPAYVACDAPNSNLIKFTYPGCKETHPAGKQMPPSGPAFTEEEAALIFQWIQEGGEATFNAATCAP